MINTQGMRLWIMVVICASTCFKERRQVWELIRHCISIGSPVIALGDINVICASNEKQGGKVFCPKIDMHEFSKFISSNLLIDLGFNGFSYTW